MSIHFRNSFLVGSTTPCGILLATITNYTGRVLETDCEACKAEMMPAIAGVKMPFDAYWVVIGTSDLKRIAGAGWLCLMSQYPQDLIRLAAEKAEADVADGLTRYMFTKRLKGSTWIYQLWVK